MRIEAKLLYHGPCNHLQPVHREHYSIRINLSMAVDSNSFCHAELNTFFLAIQCVSAIKLKPISKTVIYQAIQAIFKTIANAIRV